ncbi:MAG: nucleoside phosphatase family-domain-containing protein [Monoraphidium minutum]|nr:MAG: nucleoside phosphatase family-domain-containing protein [Monoraphidium minutum]
MTFTIPPERPPTRLGPRSCAATGFIVFLDAGSTGTRVHVFGYERPAAGRKGGGPQQAYARIHLPEPKLKVEPGLSHYATDPAGAAVSLRPLLDFARQHVPPAARRAAPVRLMATAGLRLLPGGAVAAVLDACRAELAASEFSFQPEWAEVISGRSEGLFAWAAANYAGGALEAAAVAAAVARRGPRDWSRFSGLLELGGASAQITYLLAEREPAAQAQLELDPEQAAAAQRRAEDGRGGGGGGLSPREDSEADAAGWRAPRTQKRAERRRKRHMALQLPGVAKRLFTHSYLGYGFDVLEARLAEAVRREAGGGGATDPCLPKGYASEDGRQGAGDWRACQRRVAAAMDAAACERAAAAGSGDAVASGGGGGGGGGCPEFPESLPPLPPTLLAIENFYYTAAALSLPAKADLRALEAAAAEFCARPWPDTLAGWAATGEALGPAARAAHAGQQAFLWRYCFGSALVWTLLHDVLRVPPSQALVFTNSLPRGDGAEVGLDWALGAAVCTLMECTAPGGGGGGGEGGGGREGGAAPGAAARRAALAAVLVAAALALAALAWRRARGGAGGGGSAGGGGAPSGGGRARRYSGSGGGGASGGGGGRASPGPGGARPRSPRKGGMPRSRTPSVNGLRRLSGGAPSGARRPGDAGGSLAGGDLTSTCHRFRPKSGAI